jgi:tetratricopeptide (TPR) repeat protein
MTDIAKEEAEENPFVDGMKELLKEDPPEVRAEELKNKGNLALKRGPKHFMDAIKYYTEALDVKSPNDEQNSVILANRAAVQLLKKNYGKVIQDCEEAIKLNASNTKAYYRGAKACNALEKFDKAVEFCQGGLGKEADNAEISKELGIAQAGLKKREDEAKARKAAEARKLLEEGGKNRRLRRACDEREIVLGEAVYKDIAARSGNAEAYVDEEGAIHWPILLLYDEFDQSDFMQDVREDSSVGDILATVLDPAQVRGSRFGEGARCNVW